METVIYVDDENGLCLGSLIRYTETENKTGRWVGRGTVERVRWRAVPTDHNKPITYHNMKRAAVAALRA